MSEDKYDSAMLMFIEKEDSIIPVSPVAFHVGQDSERKLNESYAGAMVVSREGEFSRIQKIETNGYWGEGLLKKFLGVLSGTRNLNVTLAREGQMELGEFKDMVIRYLKADSSKDDPYLPQTAALDVVFERIIAAKNFSEVFHEISVPPPEDCLDVL